MKKAFDQTFREIKREVNKKVLKVPGIEQKVLDATSNEAWGPHGSHLADIAQATRNYHEYQMIMSVLWKRINDTGKNWRHVYKALTVLDYLVAYGSERVIDEIREHAYQIQTLSDFQYIDSRGRDEGSNVRKKSQSLVALVNDKERIQEVRQKALVNRDKFRGASSTGGMYRPSSYSSTGGYGDRSDDDRYEGRYGNRDEDRNGYGREREWGSRDDDRYNRGDGDRYGRDPDDRHSRDDDYRGSRNGDDYQFGSRSRSFDKDKDRSYEDDDRYSSRSGGGRADEHIQDDRRFERKLSEQNRPPSYEEAVGDARSHIQPERDGDTVATPPPQESSPPANLIQGEATAVAGVTASSTNKEVNDFDEFDPRGSVSAAPPAANSAEMDFFGSLSDSFSPDALALALVPVETATTTSETAPPPNSSFGTTFVPLSSAPNVVNQPGDDPFGDGPFRAIPQDNFTAQPQNFTPMTSFQPTVMSGHPEPLQPATPMVETVPGFDFGDTFPGITYAPYNNPNVQIPSATPEFSSPQLLSSQSSNDFLGNLLPQAGPTASIPSDAAALAAPFGPIPPIPSQAVLVAPTGPPLAPVPSQALLAAPTGPPAYVQPQKDKFEPKSTVWADTLNRGLVNLNISGPKINPLADIGIDFDSINRKERREDKKNPAPSATSTITMGKAMGSGSGIGRAGATGIVPPPNPMGGSGMGMGMGGGASMGGMGMGMGTGMGMGMGMGMGGGAGMGMGPGNVPGVGMGGYGGLNQPMGMGMSNMPMGMGMNMPMGMGPGAQMRPSTQMPPSGMGMPSAYNPMMGMGGYAPQQPYGGYR